ncbi:TetR/AcrR family transcriptional regulator [Conexibacter stalactiti]|uniref:TetR/AcrR family transcriptional regulator n=1 Tax=Conexibacter stalactiti TaxID=1940611 RepID=A0ABU4HVU0_9ACTN|nr:TetR/AcrR family transcriptional regulator [Conexibacter stalactiti]MDW5597413.1 TetR/AcrR family transcriptional regulator [Conexibacter stalactiti]MEC5038055.1 TetR/AcrR family transcriptional regulator [Conexibacter stalactiti]
MPRPKQRTPELRERVLAVAIDLLATEGTAALTARAVARAAQTSTPAVYELFGDKGGLVRAVFFEGFRRLHEQLAAIPATEDPRADLVAMAAAYRAFVVEQRVLGEVMLSRPFSDFAPGPSELKASGSVRTLVVARVRRCVEAGVIAGDATDVAHVLVAMVQGMAAAENARRLGTSAAAVDRRWELAVEALLGGLAPSPNG